MPKDNKKPIIQVKLEHIPLHCPICKERFMNIFGQPLPNHAQIRCVTLNGDEMDLGICDNCIEQGVSLETCSAVLEGIKDFWIMEINQNPKISDEERKAKKDFHNSHKIATMTKISRTGKEAEKQARKMGRLE